MYVSFVTVARRQIALAAVLAGLLLAGGFIGYRSYSSRVFFEPRVLLSRFPAEEAVAVSVDVSTLRRAGLLDQSKMSQEPDYQKFVEGTGFDYRRDLDSVVASFSPGGSFFIARGRFNWNKLRDYTAHQGGSCYNDLCRVAGSRPERRISFLPLRGDTIALAVSTDDLAATRLTRTGSPLNTPIPAAPVWVSVPGAALRRETSMPTGMHLILSALTNADRVVFTFGPAGQGIEARMEAICRTSDDAKLLTNQLRSTTALLKEAAVRDKQNGEDEISGLLTAGTFDLAERSVIGKWPVRKSLLEALTAGI